MGVYTTGGMVSVHTRCMLLASTYHDSVALMHLSHLLEQLPGVRHAAVMMGTSPNKAVLREAGLLSPEGEEARAHDLLICVQAETAEATEAAIREAQRQVSAPQRGREAEAARAPRTLDAALRHLPEANLACISVPGQYAGHEARKALHRGLHVFLFSDHVPLATEEELKQLAARQGLLVMGPDCGTAILGGVPLGFANQIHRGPVGVVAASGTGLQQVVCLLARQGVGISQAIGVGGRDLQRRIGGRSMRAALRALADDADTRVVVLVSKPPEATVAARLTQEASQVGKPCVVALLGHTSRASFPASLHRAVTLEEAALAAGALVRHQAPPPTPATIPPHFEALLEEARARLQPGQRYIRALYCGGTLAYEALWLLRRCLGRVETNLDGELDASHAAGHLVVDLGAEAFTGGRPHPLLDAAIRRQHLLAAARQPEVAVVLSDVILGWGVHPDPAAALTASWEEAQELARADGRALIGIASVCGTADDPQGYQRQCQTLQAHGFLVAASNAEAVRLAVALVAGTTALEATRRQPEGTLPPWPPPELADSASETPGVPTNLPPLLAGGPRVINLGLAWFATQLRQYGVPVVHVDWRPPAGGDPHLMRLLERLQ